MSLIFVGYSHIGAISRGAALTGKTIVALPLREKSKKATTVDRRAEAVGMVLDAVRENAAEVVFCLIGGSMHAIMGVVQHPERFDFVIPDRTDLPFDEGSALVPFDAMEALMRRKLHKDLQLLHQLAKGVPVQLAQLEAPPPIKDESHPVKGGFGRDIRRYGVSQPWLRYKLWALQSRLYRRFCTQVGVDYLPNPPEVLDDDGFLAKPYWGDFVHGNDRYGALILGKLEAYTHGRPSV